MAQHTLRSTFGVELVELQTRAATFDAVFGKIGKQATQNKSANGEEQDDRQGITGLKRRGLFLPLPHSASQIIEIPFVVAATQGSKTYILRSTLHPIIIAYANTEISAIKAAEVESVADELDNEDRHMVSGCIIAWQCSDQLSAIGLLYVILSIILVNGKVISDSKLPSAFSSRPTYSLPFTQWTFVAS
jgi:melanoma-associated antigen